MTRKYFQFSLGGLLALMIVAAALVSFRGGLTSERSLHAIWVASFLLWYWKSPANAGRRILRATATTGVIWSVCILWAYRLFVTGVQEPMEGLARRGVLVAVAGVVAAFAIACFAEVLGLAVRLYRSISPPRRVICVLLLLLPLLLAWVVWDATCPPRWDPAVVISASQEEDSDVDPVRRIEQKHGVKWTRDVVRSADGRYLAILNGSQDVLILDGAIEGVAAKLASENGEWFRDLTFQPNSHGLAAIVYSDATSAKLARWDAPHWTPREAIPLDGLLARSSHCDCTTLSLDQVLLVVNYDRVGERRARVTIFTVDLLQDRLDPKEFVSATIDLPLPRRQGLWKDPWIAWIVSPKGTWIASTGSWIRAVQDSVFCAKGTPAKLAGRAIGFLPDDDHLLVYERYDGLVWKKEQTTTSAPPFWNHLRNGERYRVAIFDCRNRQVATCSRWFTRISEPRITPDRSRFLAEQQNTVLVWQIPDFRADSGSRR